MARGLSLVLALCSVVLLIATPAQGQRRRGVPINIESVPPGATVYVDSVQAAPLGQTPLRNVRVPSGEHTLIFRLANHEETRLQVQVRRRRQTFRAILRALGTIEVAAANDAARGATVRIDGQTIGTGPLGNTPVRATDLQPGRHQVRAEREGYVTFEQWVEVAGGQLVRVPILMERAAPDTGSILVGGLPGSTVTLDGTPRGTAPTVIDNVPVGPHTVVVQPPRGQPFTTTVTVIAGQRATVTPPTSQGGALLVVATAQGAMIRIDGEVVGPSPVRREGLAPGDHVIEATAEGYEPVTRTVRVTEGEQTSVTLEMSAVQGAAGQILVQSNVTGAQVLIDGNEAGTTPLVLPEPPPGPHAVVVRSPGYQDFSTTCATGPGQSCEVNATLVPQEVRVIVAVQGGIQGARLFIDGNDVGAVPFDGMVPAGNHDIQVQAPGYAPYEARVLLTPEEQTRSLDITLEVMRDGLTPQEQAALNEERDARVRSSVSHAAAPLEVDHPSMDLSIGWPYLAELRLNVGLLPFLDAGFGIRAFQRLVEFEGRVRVGFRPLRQVSVGGQVRFGGAIGPSGGFGTPIYDADNNCSSIDSPTTPEAGTQPGLSACLDPNDDARFSIPTNSAFLNVEAMGSLHFSDQGAFTLFFGVDFSSDEWGGHPQNDDVYLDVQGNGNPACTPNADGSLSCGRQGFARARLGGVLELVLTRNWNIWVLLEGILSAQPRNIYGNLLGIQTNDTQFYFRLGTTYKF